MNSPKRSASSRHLETWTYTMVSPDQLQRILAAINAGPDSGNVLRVWTAVMCYVQYGTKEIMAGRAKIAETAGIRPQEVSRAMTRLTEIGALLKLRPGATPSTRTSSGPAIW